MAFSSTAVFDLLFTLKTPVAAGAEILSPVVDSRASNEIHLLLNTAAPNPDLHWTILFGPTQAGTLLPTATGVFGRATEAIVAPTFGPKMAVAIRNTGTEDAWADGNYYYAKG